MGRALLDIGCTAIAYETVQLPDGSLPLLAPMSRIAGRMSVQAGAHFLEAAHGGKGVLMGGIPGVARARVTVLGAGVVGWHAIDVAVGMGARLVVLDVNLAKLEAIEAFWGGRVETLYSSRQTVERYVTDADLLIGAVLVAGDRAPVVVGEDLVAAMEAGSVLVDVAIDQGGCVATSQETTHHEPTFVSPRRGALLRRQHAGCGAPHLDVRADERHDDLCGRAGRTASTPRCGSTRSWRPA